METEQPIASQLKPKSRVKDFYIFDGKRVTQDLKITKDVMGKLDTLHVIVGPSAYAVASNNGVAIANPISKVVVNAGRLATVQHKPQAVAVVGPGGIAHAQSDLYIYQYLKPR